MRWHCSPSIRATMIFANREMAFLDQTLFLALTPLAIISSPQGRAKKARVLRSAMTIFAASRAIFAR
jgi:hypothetical protein